MKNSIALLITCCVLSACADKSINKFSDPVLIKIADFQDRRQSDSLYTYFEDKNPTYRKEAVLAFASVQDTLATEKLQQVLRFDTDKEVRKSAAFALGQIPFKPAAASLWRALQDEKNPTVLREIIEGCGKTFKRGDLDQFVVTTTDSLAKEGLIWAYYYFGMKRYLDSTYTIKLTEFLKPAYGLQTRLGAANFFARGSFQTYLAEAALTESALNDKSAWVRAGSTAALRKTKTVTAQETLKKILKSDSDYRVRVSAAVALQDFPILEVKGALYEALKDENVNVAIATSEVLQSKATRSETKELIALAKNISKMRIRANLYGAALAAIDSAEIISQLTELYKSESNPYSKAALITALGSSTKTWSFIDQELQQSKEPVIKSSAASALVSINENPLFDSKLKKQYAEVYVRAIQTGDAAVIGIVAEALKNPLLGYKGVVTDYTFLYEAKKKLSLPKDNEALQPLEAAIAYFEGKEANAPVKNEFNHPIDWELVKTIPRDQKVLIKTDKGDITLQLLVDEAPGSVANFVQLVNSKYFDSKNFHRVVPNFVIQGGCNRGDGWGSEDYSIRSEFSGRRYTEGSVGMASAGKDTEGTQWFITHSPTPHLNGRYSIFAITLSGIDVVHQIEVGDKILSVTLIK